MVCEKKKNLASTNDYLRQLSNESELAEGYQVTAENQYEGKGQRGKSWFVEPGLNLTTSIYLKPNFLAGNKIFLLSEICVLAISDTIRQLSQLSAVIKWPNDLFLNGAKCCGVLIECQWQGKKLKDAVIGIGLNVNQARFDPSLGEATSLFAETGTSFSLEEIRQVLNKNLERWYSDLRMANYDFIRSRYHEQLYGIGAELSIYRNDQLIKAVPQQVLDDGRIELLLGKQREVFGLNEISFPRPSA